MRSRQAGFTLVEIALVMIIISAVLAGGIAGFQSFRDSARYSETDAYLSDTRTALLRFTLVNGYLPCPDSEGNDGIQDVENHSSGKTCKAAVGNIPWRDLGVPANGPWQWPAFYAVNQGVASRSCDKANKDSAVCFFENEEAPLVALETPASTTSHTPLEIKNSAGDVIASNLVAVVGVVGKNTLQTQADCSAMSADEQENCNNDETFVLDVVRTSVDNFFDDKLVWIHANTVKGTLKDAGLL